jgi:signal transduction histidine kinase
MSDDSQNKLPHDLTSVEEEGEHLKDVAKLLYGQNAELAVRNQTLSLLRKLYQFSILTLQPEVIAEKITQAIQSDLSYELVGVMILDAAKQELVPLKFAVSKRFETAKGQSSDAFFESVKIPSPLGQTVLKSVLGDKLMADAPHLKLIWGSVIGESTLEKIEKEANIKTSLLYPLVIEERVLGLIVMCLNHDYASLGKFERESIESFVNVIAVALDRAFLYQALKSANEKLQELDRLKTEFLSFASHQVKAPLAVMKGFATLILEGSYGPIGEKIHEVVFKIKASCDQMIALVNNLLDLRRLEEGKMQYDFAEVDLKDFVSQVVDELRPLAEQKKLELSFASEEGEIRAKVDLQKFKQVVQNFVDNAIKYTPAGWIKVELKKDGTNALIAISDSGMGISTELLPKLFQQFSRDPQSRKLIQGTGLGLYIAKQIVEAHSGSVEVQSAGTGTGSTFLVRIPCL